LPAERIAGRVEWNGAERGGPHRRRPAASKRGDDDEQDHQHDRERNGTEWWSGSRWTPASDEARQFASEALAEAEGEDRCDARDWIVVEIEAE
jgi:hypothetical protein